MQLLLAAQYFNYSQDTYLQDTTADGPVFSVLRILMYVEDLTPGGCVLL